MNLGGVRPRDIVECDVRGRRFYAIVRDKHATPGSPTRLTVKPITPGINYFEVPARQVIGHWRRSLQGLAVASRAPGAGAKPDHTEALDA